MPGQSFLYCSWERDGAGSQALPKPRHGRGQSRKAREGPAGLHLQQAEKPALTFLAMFAKWAPQALQLGSAPVGEGKELYPGLE